MDFDIYLRFMFALILVLGLIAALTWAARRFGFGGQLTPNAGRSPRLSVIEVRTLDARRKLVLLRRDASEHLVLLGPNQDLLLESGIAASPEAAQPVTLATATAPAPALKSTGSTGSTPTRLSTAERRNS